MKTTFARVRESDVLTGLVGIGVVILLLVVAGYFYVSPIGKQTVHFTTQDAASVSGGEDVRVSGISVGKVTEVELKKTAVEVTLDVDSSIPIGDRTRVDVRLLTAVGGYFVTLVPAGPITDNSRTIPEDRVNVPYTIADALQQLPRITGDVQGVPVEETLGQLSDGLQANTESVRNIVSGMRSLADVIDKQKKQVTSTLDMASNYLTTFENSRDYLFQLVRKINILESEYYTYRAGFTQAYAQLGDVAMRLGVLGNFYLNHTDEVYNQIVAAREFAGRMKGQMDGLINNLGPLRERVMSVVGNNDGPKNANSRFILDASNFCLPVPGRSC